MDTLDMRGKACPMPVIETKKWLESAVVGAELEVVVDNAAAVENLAKFAGQKGYGFARGAQDAGDFHVTLSKAEETPQPSPHVSAQSARTTKRVVVVSSSTMGDGDERLGATLLAGFLYALTEQDTVPDTVLFYNGGVHLTTEGSGSLDDLRALESAGAEILSCGTCLNHYGLTEKLAVGGITNMYVIVEKQLAADVVLKP